MEDGFFFDGIDMLGHDSTINEANYVITPARPYTAQPLLTIPQSATMCANCTL